MATFNEGIMTLSGPIQHKRGTSAALAASNYVPAAGEIVIATDTGEMRSGDGVNTTTTTTGKALDATQGKALNDRLGTVEGITGIDCGEITAD